eukprot:TRINITY_DN105426_c0_g1_i1.p1 TRINITY_DN105426_c0_g1~~TRINITY_DN105426_c0_g1_i1.p1  ORF type:complete len:216 (-),score=59.38 TRINITY_DN105426_c0_g1_i1:8-655(-)
MPPSTAAASSAAAAAVAAAPRSSGESSRGSSSSGWALPALLGSAAVLVAIFPERTVAVLLGLLAVAATPVAADLFGGFSFPGFQTALAAVRGFFVDFLIEVLDPSLQKSLPLALAITFEEDAMGRAMVKLMDNIMADPKFIVVLKQFIRTSMTDEALLGAIKLVIQEALADSDLYKSAMHGVADTFNPLSSKRLSAFKDKLLGREHDAECKGQSD